MSFSSVNFCFKRYFLETTISMAAERCVCSIFKVLISKVDLKTREFWRDVEEESSSASVWWRALFIAFMVAFNTAGPKNEIRNSQKELTRRRIHGCALYVVGVRYLILVMWKVCSLLFSLGIMNPVSVSRFAQDSVSYLGEHDSSSEQYL